VVVFTAGCADQPIAPAANQSAAADRESHTNSSSTAGLYEGQAKLGVPKIIEEEHQALHEELETAIKAGGKTGEAAKLVEERLSSHFKKEEEYALPQLGLLAELATGRISPDAKSAIELSDKLKAELPKMLEEHKAIVGALDVLKKAATEEKSEVGLKFVETLSHHAVNEEQVTYPAAILVGEYLKLKSQPK
jgi:hemerythrin-like domain-containing protein